MSAWLCLKTIYSVMDFPTCHQYNPINRISTSFNSLCNLCEQEYFENKFHIDRKFNIFYTRK